MKSENITTDRRIELLRGTIGFLSSELTKAYQIIGRMQKQNNHLIRKLREQELHSKTTDTMKKSVPLILLIFSCVELSSQSIIPKLANTIVITDTVPGSDLFNTTTRYLFESGYGILSSDRSSGVITTTPKPFKSGTIKLNLFILDSLVTIRGDFQGPSITLYGVTDNSSSKIEYKGMKNSPLMNAWNEMKKTADQIPGKKEYLIK